VPLPHAFIFLVNTSWLQLKLLAKVKECQDMVETAVQKQVFVKDLVILLPAPPRLSAPIPREN
jgi:hypothetical protein